MMDIAKEMEHQDPVVKTEVKIEIDIAEDLPQILVHDGNTSTLGEVEGAHAAMNSEYKVVTAGRQHGCALFDATIATELMFDDDFKPDIVMQEGSDDDEEFDHFSDEEEQDNEPERNIVQEAPADVDSRANASGDGTEHNAPTKESDQDGHVDYVNNWGKDLRNFPHIPPFTAQTGIKLDLGEDPSALDVYKLFLTSDILKHIKTETNRYAKAVIEQKQREGHDAGHPLSKRSLFSTWRPVTLGELQDFLAICMHMGIVKKPRFTDYWSKHPALHSSYAANLMQRDRFIAIMMFLHVNDNTSFIPRGREGHDPIHKVRPFINHLQEKFKEIYYPEQSVCISEAMCPFKGRSRFKVYLKDKNKWGFKFYELCESSTGYVHNFEMFCSEPGVSNKPIDVVRRLINPLLHRGHHLYIDNYYCEPTICQELSEKGTMVCGTVRKNRQQMPKELAQGKLQTGAIDFRRRGNVVACRWMDKKDVYILSTFHMPHLRLTQARFEQKEKPVAVISYITNMAGVDHSDQLRSYFPMHRKSCKWWKKPFFHLLTLVMIQTMIILNKHRTSQGKKRLSLEDVVKAICIQLPALQKEEPEAAADGPACVLKRIMPNGVHFAEEIPIPEGKQNKVFRNCKGKQNKVFRNCKVCYEKARAAGTSAKECNTRRKQTSIWCPDCQVPLCLNPCFKLFHTEENYLK